MPIVCRQVTDFFELCACVPVLGGAPMNWPPKERWSTIAALWATCGAPSACTNERDKAFVTLKQYQNDFGLSDCQMAYIAEHQALEPVSTAEREYNAFEVTLHALDGVG